MPAQMSELKVEAPTNEKDDIRLLDEAGDKEIEQDDEIPEEKEVIPDDEDDKEKEDNDEEDDKEPKKEEKKEKEEDDEDEELATNVEFKTLKKQYPDIFTKNPQLREIISREAKFSEHFPELEDAEEALTNSAAFKTMENTLLSGNPELMLTKLKEVDNEAFERVVKDLPRAISKLSKDSFIDMTSSLVKRSLLHCAKLAAENEDKNLENAVKHISKTLFGSVDIKEEEQKENKPDPEREKFENERKEYLSERFNEFKDDTFKAIGNEMDALISSGLEDVTNNKIKSAIISETATQIGEVLKNDRRHMATIKALWEKAAENRFNKSHVDKIRTAYVNRAKSLIRDIRLKVKSEYLSDKTPSVKKSDEKNKPVIVDKKKAEISGDKQRTVNAKNVDSKQVDYRKTTDMDLLSGRVTLKR